MKKYFLMPLATLAAAVKLGTSGFAAEPAEVQPQVQFPELKATVELKSEANFFEHGPREGNEEWTTRFRVPLEVRLDKEGKWTIGGTPALRFTESNREDTLFYNEPFEPGRLIATLDDFFVSYKDGPLMILGGKFTDPFKLNFASYDKDLRPEGIAGSYTLDKVLGLDSLQIASGAYLPHDWNGLNASDQKRFELMGTKKIGPVIIEAGTAYSNIRKIVGDRGGSGVQNGEDFDVLEFGGKVNWNTGNGFISRVGLSGQYARNLAIPTDNESGFIGFNADLFGNILGFQAGYLIGRDHRSFPFRVYMDDAVKEKFGPFFGLEIKPGNYKPLENTPWKNAGFFLRYYIPTPATGEQIERIQIGVEFKVPLGAGNGK
jgi:hypothetical protein